MNTILQKRIEEAANEFDKEGLRVIFENGANFILNNLWISVDEALPEEEERVLVTHQYGYQVAAIYKDGLHSFWGVSKVAPIGATITHWMAIPNLEGGEK